MRLRDHFLPGLSAFACGAVLGAYTGHPFAWCVVFATPTTLLIWGGYGRRLRLVALLGVVCACVALGVLRGGIARENARCGALCARDGESVEVSGFVADEPETRMDKQRFTLRTPIGDVLVSLPGNPRRTYGDMLSVRGVAHVPENFTTENGAIVRYSALLRSRGIMVTLDGRSSRTVSANEAGVAPRILLAVKRHIVDTAESLPSPEGQLLAGMIFGGKGGLPSEVQEDFKRAGIVHIVVLSGENLTIVAALFVLIFRRRLGFVGGIILSSCVVAAYAFMGGMQSATVRALVVLFLIFGAYAFKREPSFRRLFIIGAVTLVAWNPFILLDDPSFQFAVLALGGVIWVGPVLTDALLRRSVSIRIAEFLGPVLGAQLVLLPFLVWSAQAMPSYALLGNLIVLPLLSGLTFAGFGVVGLGLVSHALYTFVSYPVYLALHILVSGAHLIAMLPGAYIPVHIGGIPVICCYVFGCLALRKIWRTPGMTPLSRFTLHEERKAIEDGRVPWMPPEDTSVDAFDGGAIVDWSE